MVNAELHGAGRRSSSTWRTRCIQPRRTRARLLVRNALRAVDFGGCERMVRINQVPLGLEDLDAIVPEAPELILIPKTETVEQVKEVDERILNVLAHDGLAHSIWLMPILESALGLENAFAIASASPRVVALTIGLEDYTADLGVVKTAEGAETLFARQRLVNAAKAAHIQAIDSVYGDIDDLDGLRAWGLRSRAMGFEGMGCVHPRQIPVIHEAFAPTAEEIEKAERIVAAFDEAKAKGLGVVSLGFEDDRPAGGEAARSSWWSARGGWGDDRDEGTGRERGGTDGAGGGQRSRANALQRREQARTRGRQARRLRSAPARTSPPTATSARPTWKPRSSSAGCATG